MTKARPVSARPSRLPFAIRLWLTVTALLPIFLNRLARKAHDRQNADPKRLAERLGKASIDRPKDMLIWLHAASVGEVASVKQLASGLADRHNATLLLTTTTATAADTVARALPDALHQFAPIDTPKAVSGFLDHWRPDAALFVEGDLWPRMIVALDQRECPMSLINIRPSRSRSRFPSVYANLLSRMRCITVQDTALLNELVTLGLEPDRLHAPGNLKADIAAPHVDDVGRSRISSAANGRGLWAAVSTHPGEEEVILDAHAALEPDALLVLVPRHPQRGDDVAADLTRRSLRVSRHSRGEAPDGSTDVHLIDAIGETGTVYAATGLAFIGGSLLPGIGGHTPFEPAALGCATLTGPHTKNFAAAYDAFVAANATRVVTDANDLSRQVAELFADRTQLSSMQEAARTEYQAQAGATERTLELLAPVLAKVKRG